MKPRLALLVCVFVVGVLFVATQASKAPARPDIVLITVDTLRADHLGCYGYARRTSPAVDALASSGTLFECVMAPRGLTWPSLMSLHTSLYPVGHGVRDNGQVVSQDILSLADVLKSNGYETRTHSDSGNGHNPGFGRCAGVQGRGQGTVGLLDHT